MDRLCKSNRYLLHFICHPLVKQKAILEYFYLIFHFFSSIYYWKKNGKRRKEKRITVKRIFPFPTKYYEVEQVINFPHIAVKFTHYLL